MYQKSTSLKGLTVDKTKSHNGDTKEYQFTLEEKYRKIAEIELNETDEARESSIKKIRDWVLANPAIKKCRTDDLFLLRFLRVCKYNVPRACAKLENFLIIHQEFPAWFRNVSIDDPGVRQLLESGYVVPLPERDRYGRLVLFFVQEYLNPDIHSIADIVRTADLIFQMFYDDERTQIAGHVWIYDDTGSTLKHFRQWGINDIKHGVRYISKGMPIRSRGYVRVNMAPWLIVLSDIIKPFLAEKIKNRFHFPKNFDNLDGIDKSILPKEYGGTVPHRTMVQEFVKYAEQFRDECRLQDEMAIELKKKEKQRIKKITEELSGNFEDLQVD